MGFENNHEIDATLRQFHRQQWPMLKTQCHPAVQDNCWPSTWIELIDDLKIFEMSLEIKSEKGMNDIMNHEFPSYFMRRLSTQ